MVTAIPVAAQFALIAQVIERGGDLAAIRAADGFDQMRIEERTGLQRLFDGLVVGQPTEDLGGAAGVDHLAALAKGMCAHGPLDLSFVMNVNVFIKDIDRPDLADRAENREHGVAGLAVDT